jgi:hypothetical protein
MDRLADPFFESVAYATFSCAKIRAQNASDSGQKKKRTFKILSAPSTNQEFFKTNCFNILILLPDHLK